MAQVKKSWVEARGYVTARDSQRDFISSLERGDVIGNINYVDCANICITPGI
jgi:hypothetical protein